MAKKAVSRGAGARKAAQKAASSRKSGGPAKAPAVAAKGTTKAKAKGTTKAKAKAAEKVSAEGAGKVNAKGAGPGADEVSVRMYRQGLGDCFLLSFPPTSGEKRVHVLIDCGVLKRTDREADRMRSVVDDIAAETDGEVDLLIVTHEHWDHIAGFSHAEDYFKPQPGQARERLHFKRVWLSWAENLQGDRFAQTVYNDLARKKKALKAALGLVDRLGLQDKWASLAAANDANARRMIDDIETVRAVLGFLGVDDERDTSALAAAKAARPPGVTGMSLGETMDWLRSLVKSGDSCVPGQRRALPGVAGVNVYVLGPPRDEDLLKQMDASGEAGYALAGQVSFLDAAERLDAAGGQPGPGPIAARYRVTREQGMASPFFRESYGFPDDPLGDEGEPWRRIDDEWLVSGLGQLALQIDKRVNNTSLAVAFELPDGRTLIFPGDAQFGNWLSWDKVKFRDKSGKNLPVTTKQLLNRAVFYKVGHHGSHNATRPASLHEMNGGDLVAMIPTDEAFALKQPKPGSWRMPAAELAADLEALTAGRILRADRNAADLAERGAATDVSRRWGEFAGRVMFSDRPLLSGLDAREFPLHIEYRLPFDDRD
jgi:hypothetical protein